MRSYELKEMLEQQQVPKMALVVYQNDKSQSIYIESHRISKQGRMLAGKPLTQKCIAEHHISKYRLKTVVETVS